MTLTYLSVLDHGIEPSAATLTLGFDGYFVPIQIPPAGLLSMVRSDSVDLTLSRVILQDDQPVGVAMIARRGWTSRLAAMSIIPHARGKGIGDAAVRQLLTEARARGDTSMNLEVIEQNIPAVKLYRKCGFETKRRLVGFSGQLNNITPDAPIEQIDLLQVARALITHAPTDLPWQISGESLIAAGPPGVGFRNENSYIALTNPDASAVVIRAIVTVPSARRRGSATALLRSVIARYPDKTWRITPTFPEELARLYDNLGLAREKLTQWQMSAPLVQ